MTEINNSIICDVTRCKHNSNGRNCTLTTIRVTNDCTDCTCCGSYDCCENCD